MRITINELEKTYPDQEIYLQDVLDGMASNTMYFIVFRNDQFVNRLKYLKTKLNDGDALTIFPLVNGA